MTIKSVVINRSIIKTGTKLKMKVQKIKQIKESKQMQTLI